MLKQASLCSSGLMPKFLFSETFPQKYNIVAGLDSAACEARTLLRRDGHHLPDRDVEQLVPLPRIIPNP